MSYDSRLSGEMKIYPPLKWAHIKDSDFLPANRRTVSLRYDLEYETRDDEDGQHTIIRAVAVVPVSVDCYSHYGIEDELKQIAAEVRAAGSALRGWIVRDGDDTGDVERYWVEGDAVKSEKARLSWPDGSAVEL